MTEDYWGVHEMENMMYINIIVRRREDTPRNWTYNPPWKLGRLGIV